MDSECVLDIIILRASPPPAPYHQRSYNFYIKIYKSGNVNIKEQPIDPHNGAVSNMCDQLVINDGIPFPPEVISMLKYLFGMKCPISCRNIFESIKILHAELVKEHKLKTTSRAEVSTPFEPLSASKNKKISELERQVVQISDELGKERQTICQLLSDAHAVRLGADKKIAELVKSQDKEIDKWERIVTQKHKESAAQSKRINELERLVEQKDKKIRELEKDPSDTELDIRAKEGAKKHAEAKAKLQKLYDERPMINLMDGESIGDLLVCM